MRKNIKEIFIYFVVAISSLFGLGFAVHMLVGGMVSPETEYSLISITCLTAVAAIVYMVWDVIQHRKGE
jgi:hypothetical protein